MSIKVCKICGKDFEAKSSACKYCSDSCRTKGASLIKRMYQVRYHKSEEYKMYRKLYHIKNYIPTVKYCKSCGTQLLNARQTWCLDCLFDDYIKTKSNKSLIRLSNRGYNKARIIEELRNRR